MNWLVKSLCLVLVVFVASSLGCLEPDRETYRDDAASDFCDEAERCGSLGDGMIPDSHSDCVVDMRSEFNSRWPQDECGDGQINPDDYDRCMSRALDYACDPGLFSGWDFLDRCSADQVCTN